MSVIDQDFVRDIIERHSDASGGNGRDFHNGAYAAMADEIEQAVAATLGRGTWSDFDMRMAYHMGYDDALARRKPDAGKVVDE